MERLPLHSMTFESRVFWAVDKKSFTGGLLRSCGKVGLEQILQRSPGDVEFLNVLFPSAAKR